MNLTDVHTNRHLTLTVLQSAFSLRSVSVSYLCYIHSHHYDCCYCEPPKPNQCNTNYELPHNTPPTHLGQVERYFGNSVYWRHKRLFVALL